MTKMKRMMPAVGQILYGYGQGCWDGSDEFADKRIEAFGDDWIVARTVGATEGKGIHIALFKDRIELEEFVCANRRPE